jgi:ornithine cyclodeaminase/alanine dehydrogenase-like protein (mu-crystallin family)
MPYVIDEHDTRKLIDMASALRVVERIFRDRAAGKVRSLPRRRLSARARQLNIMAAWQQDRDIICLRAYMGRANTITLYNGRTGEISLVLNARYLSSLRTGAASGVAARYLAPRGASVLGLIGTGKQAAYQLEAIVRTCQIKQVLVFGRHRKRLKEFISRMSRNLAVELRECPSIDKIEKESDIVALATNSTTPVIGGARLKEEVLVITIGANSDLRHEVSTKLIRRMDLVVTDDVPTAKGGSGDLIAACNAGALKWEKVVPLERIVSRPKAPRRSQKILFQSNGIADEDLAVARYVMDQVRRKRIKLKSIPGL